MCTTSGGRFRNAIPSPMASKQVIRAAEFCHPEEGPVDSANRIAREALSALGRVQAVSIAMEGVPGASSSFFNVIFSELFAALGAAAIQQRVTFTGPGKTQARIADRSRAAVLGS